MLVTETVYESMNRWNHVFVQFTFPFELVDAIFKQLLELRSWRRSVATLLIGVNGGLRTENVEVPNMRQPFNGTNSCIHGRQDEVFPLQSIVVVALVANISAQVCEIHTLLVSFYWSCLLYHGALLVSKYLNYWRSYLIRDLLTNQRLA